jgi:hypothetical protein
MDVWLHLCSLVIFDMGVVCLFVMLCTYVSSFMVGSHVVMFYRDLYADIITM